MVIRGGWVSSSAGSQYVCISAYPASVTHKTSISQNTKQGVALGGALDDHKEAVEGAIILAREATAAKMKEEEDKHKHDHKEGGHKHEHKDQPAHGEEGHTCDSSCGHDHSHDHDHSHGMCGTLSFVCLHLMLGERTRHMHLLTRLFPLQHIPSKQTTTTTTTTTIMIV